VLRWGRGARARAIREISRWDGDVMQDDM